MPARLVKEWKESLAEKPIEELAIEHDVSTELLEKVKAIIDRAHLADDVILCVGESTDQW